MGNASPIKIGATFQNKLRPNGDYFIVLHLIISSYSLISGIGYGYRGTERVEG